MIISLSVAGEVVATAGVKAGAVKESVRIKAVPRGQYALVADGAMTDATTLVAKRVGKNLQIIDEDVVDSVPVLVIEEFYEAEAQLASVDTTAMRDGDAIRVPHSITTLADSFDQSDVTTTSSIASGVFASVAAVAGALAFPSSAGATGERSAPPQNTRLMGSSDAAEIKEFIAPALEDVAAVAVTGEEDARRIAEAPPTIEEAAPMIVDAVPTSDENASMNLEAAPKSIETAPKIVDAVPALEGNASADVIQVVGIDSVPSVGSVVDSFGATQGVVAEGGYTDDGRPLIKGKAPSGTLVHIYDGVFLVGRAQTDANGEWSYRPRLPFSDGRHEFSVLHEYPDGGYSDFSDGYVIHVDRTVPELPVIFGVNDDVGRITGEIAHESVTDDAKPTITGEVEPHATVVVYDKGKEIGRALADANGNWSFTPEPALKDGVHILSYSAVDRAGNQSEMSDVFEFTVDTRAETVRILAAEDDAGPIVGTLVSGSATDDARPELYGTATAGGLVKIYEGATLLGQVQAGADGFWSFTPESPLADGVHLFEVTVTLEAKGESARSKAFSLTIDSTAPVTPVLETVFDDQGTTVGNLASGDTTDDAAPALSGTGEPNSTVIISDKGVEIGRAPVGADGRWSFHPGVPLALGEHVLAVQGMDAVGNLSAPSGGFVLIVEKPALPAPVITSVLDDVGSEQGVLHSGAFTDDTQPTFSGTATPGAVVILKDGNVEIGRAQVNAQGLWVITPVVPLVDGIHNVTATAVSDGAIASPPSDSFDFRVSVGGGGLGASSQGFENFNSLSINATMEGTVLPSGVKLTGSFDSRYFMGGINNPYWGDYGDVPMEDRHMALQLSSGGTMHLPSGASYVSFYNTYGVGGRVSILNEKGEVIGKLELLRYSLLSSYAFNSFSAPPGEMIAAIRYDGGSGSGPIIENLCWGDGRARMISVTDAHVDGSGAELVRGRVDVADVNVIVQVSVDGGNTWIAAARSGLDWVAVSKQPVQGSVEILARLVDVVSGRATGVEDRHVTKGHSLGGAPEILDIDVAAGVLTSLEASKGAGVLVSLVGTGARAGDTVYVKWGINSQDRVLSIHDIERGEVLVNVSSHATSEQGWRYDFQVTASIVSNNRLGPVSEPYKVIAGGFSTRSLSDALNVASVIVTNNTYNGNGVVVSTDGSHLAKTLATSSALAGLTVTGAGNGAVNAMLALDGPATKFSLRLSGLDNGSGGATIVVYDTAGTEMHREVVQGTLSSGRYTKTYSYVAPEGVDVGSIKVLAASSSITLDQFSQTQALHVADTRDVNVFSNDFDTFYGTDGDDVLTLNYLGHLPHVDFGMHGGRGVDTLVIKSWADDQTGTPGYMSIDEGAYGTKRQLAGSLTGFEIIDFVGGPDRLNLSVQNVLQNGQVDLFHESERHTVQMMVKGRASKSIGLSDTFDAREYDFGDWMLDGQYVIDGVKYNSYLHSGFDAEILVQQDMRVYLFEGGSLA